MIGEKISELRIKQKISQRELGRRAGISGQMVSKIENNLTQPSMETIKKIALALDQPMANLIGDDMDLGFQAHIQGYTKDIDTYYKSPSDVESEKESDSINTSFDNFASDEYLQKRLGYNYEEFTLLEQNELMQFILKMLSIKINDIRYRNESDDLKK